MLIEYAEPAIITAKGVELKQAATAVILSLSSQDANTLTEFTYGLSFNFLFLIRHTWSMGLEGFQKFDSHTDLHAPLGMDHRDPLFYGRHISSSQLVGRL